MADQAFVADDLWTVKREDQDEDVFLAWGDPVEDGGPAGDGKHRRIRFLDHDGKPVPGLVKSSAKLQSKGVLQFSLVDVQQGDGMILETPKGQVVLIDGGDNQLFARYVAARYRGTSDGAPKTVHAIVVTHGDADHFAGLNFIRHSESFADKDRHKRLFIRLERLYHNGLIKASGSDAKTIFGKTVEKGNNCFVVDLEDDFLSVSPDRMNTPFRNWQKSLKHWNQRGPIQSRRLAAGDDNAFDFLREEGVEVDVLGPITQEVTVEGTKTAVLPLLHDPPREPGAAPSRSFSASHTINGHSIVLRLRFGNVRILLGGDLNQESMETLRTAFPDSLQAEIVKVPHHGSADFDRPALEAMQPFIWLISSGDESSRKEFIHPRANLMGSLGACSRPGIDPLIFCTELAAFFELRGWSQAEKTPKGKKTRFFGFERTSFGIVHLRTDGERLLIFTHSGKKGLKEAYRFRVDADHQVTPQKVVKR
jgi:hypothetical protein